MLFRSEKAIADGCQLIDADGVDIPSSEAANYIVIIDGQHRVKAALQMGLDLSNLMLFEAYVDAKTKELLSVSNIESKGWSNSDFVSGALLFNPDSTEAQFFVDLTEIGCSMSTISDITTWKSGLTKAKLAKFMAGERLVVECDLERAKVFLEAARTKFDNSFIAKRYLIRAVIALSNAEGYPKVCEAITKLTDGDLRSIKGVSPDVKEQTIKTCLRRIIAESEITAA